MAHLADLEEEPSPWVELEDDAWRGLWQEYQDEFGRATFCQPLATEPAPSLTWDLLPVRDAGPPDWLGVGQLVCAVLEECLGFGEAAVFHDWVHPSSLFLPCCVPEGGPGENEAKVLAGWRDPAILVPRDLRFGLVASACESTLCVFGAPALRAINRLGTDALGPLMRRDGIGPRRRQSCEASG
ncbi:DUF2716 domain-containing protein [Longispora albida]|uniref:DUF2716 domain-containing protein n=1 Tax=Longispora albida TaxID=203523 RepID=UPI00036B1705|nr:DUF2716 domain-containing protein [Longispora albida]